MTTLCPPYPPTRPPRPQDTTEDWAKVWLTDLSDQLSDPRPQSRSLTRILSCHLPLPPTLRWLEITQSSDWLIVMPEASDWPCQGPLIGFYEYVQVRPRSFTPRPHTPDPRPANDDPEEEENVGQEADNEVRHENTTENTNCCCCPIHKSSSATFCSVQLQNKSPANFEGTVFALAKLPGVI